MLRGVGQALLHDPVGGQPDGGRHRTDVAVQVQAHVDAGAAELLDQAVMSLPPGNGLIRSVGPRIRPTAWRTSSRLSRPSRSASAKRPRRLIRVVGQARAGPMTRATATP